MRMLCALIAGCVGFASDGEAEVRRDENGLMTGPPLGCYARVWSDAELAGSPQQVIKAMRAKAHVYDGGPALSDHYMSVDVILADQGLAEVRGMSGARLASQLSCGQGYKPDFPFCYSYCGGHRMVFPRLDDKGMVFRIERFEIVNGTACGGAKMDLAGGRNAKVAYRLDRVEMRECEGL